MGKKVNLPLLIGIGLPTAVVATVALAVFVPRILAPRPKFDVLMVSENHYSKEYFSVVGGKLTRLTRKDGTGRSQLYRYRVPDGGAVPIEFDEAVKLKLDLSTISPDKYAFEAPGHDYGLFDLFGSRNRSTAKLRGHGTVWTLEGMPDRNECEFLGWIVGE